MISPTPRSVSSVQAALEAIVVALQCHGLRESRLTIETISHWDNLSKGTEGGWMKVAKYKLAAFFAYHTHQPLPQKPFTIADKPGHLLGGAQGRWLTQALKGSHRMSILATLKQTKKGMPRPSKHQLEASVEPFIEKMTSLPPTLSRPQLLVPWAAVDDYPARVETLLTKETVKAQLRRTVHELFDRPLTMEERIEPFFPSTSANYINSRKELGAIGTILEHPALLNGLRQPGGVLPRERPQREEEEYRQREEEETKVSLNENKFRDHFKTLYWRMLAEANKEIPEVIPVALAEPLKIRMITKGPPMQQTVLRPIWKAIHRRLRRHKVFRLIGTPATEQEILNGLGRDLKEHEVYLSGDYEAATDNLQSWVSETVGEELASVLKLGAPERKLLIQSLTGHLFLGKEQKRGQLMGSITSFPILCIANAAVCRWAMELAEERSIALHDALLLINGDDCALRAHKTVYAFWQRLTAFIGLKESVGKTYTSREFVEINSTIFRRVPEFPLWFPEERINGHYREACVRKSCLRQVRYVNGGLLLGLKRSQGRVGIKDQDDPRGNLGVRADSLLQLAPEKLHERIMKVFLSRHRTLLEKMRLPWYLPDWLGGVGLPTGSWGQPSDLDLRLARRILNNWEELHPIPLANKEAPWKTWLLAQTKLPKPVYTDRPSEATEEYRRMVGLHCVNLLFDSDIKLSDMYEAVNGSTKVSRAIARNAKLYSPRGLRDIPKPLEGPIARQRLYPNFSSSERTSTLLHGGSANVSLD